jgi:hypothetical protein
MLKAVAVVFVRLYYSPSTCEDDTKHFPTHTMKNFLITILFLSALHAQEPISEEAVLIDPLSARK